MTLGQKIRTAFLGKTHDLLDKTTDSVSALRQTARDLEQNVDKMRDNAAVQAGLIQTKERECEELEMQIGAETERIRRVLAGDSPEKQQIARAKGITVLDLTNRLAHAKTETQAQREASAAVDHALAQLEAKQKSVVARIQELERADRDSRVKEQAAKTLRSAEALLNTGADISVDNIQERIKAQNDIANEKFRRALGSAQTEPDAEIDSEALDNLLAELQPKAIAAPEK